MEVEDQKKESHCLESFVHIELKSISHSLFSLPTASESHFPPRIFDINLETVDDFFKYGLVHHFTKKWWPADEGRYKFLIIQVPLKGTSIQDLEAIKMKVEGNIVLLDVPIYPHVFDKSKHKAAYSSASLKEHEDKASFQAAHDKISRYLDRSTIIQRFHINLGEKYKQVKVKNSRGEQTIPDVLSDWAKVNKVGSLDNKTPINLAKYDGWYALHGILEKGLSRAGVASLLDMKVMDNDDPAAREKKLGNIDKFEVEMKKHIPAAVKFPVATEKVFVLKSMKPVDAAVDENLAKTTFGIVLSDSDSG